MPVQFVSHGGPTYLYKAEPDDPPIMKQMDKDSELVASYKNLRYPVEPKAILVVSAHWEERPLRITCQERHPTLLYDYYGFPEETYHVKYPSPGSPELAKRVAELLKAAGHDVVLDTKRNLDHGAFLPLMLMYPEAKIPVVQLSLHASLDPARHIMIGRALQPLRDEGILILASGSSTHDLRGMFGAAYRNPTAYRRAVKEFTDALNKAMESDPAVRDDVLINWRSKLPYSREMHPREEHLIPLMVAAGAAGSDRGKLQLDIRPEGIFANTFYIFDSPSSSASSSSANTCPAGPAPATEASAASQNGACGVL